MSSTGTLAYQILKGGHRLLCANLADPVPADAACDRGPAATSTVGMSAGHVPPLAARGCGAAPGLSAGHGPLHAVCGRGLAATAAPNLSTKHGPSPTARDCDAAPGLSPGTGLCVLLAVAISLLLPLLVCQPGMGLCVLLTVAVSLLLPGRGGHAVQIVSLTINDR
jgi:hypothetical protein